MPFAWLSAGFQSLPPLPTNKSGPSGADSGVGGFVYVLGPCGSLQRTFLWSWSPCHHHNSHRILQPDVLRLYFPTLELWVVLSISLPSCSSGLSAQKCGTTRSAASASPTQSSSHGLAMCSLHPGCLSLALLPIWMNVSSLTPWLSGFHTVWFSGSSGFFVFFLICCCPSFGCVRKQSVSIYAPILAGSGKKSVLNLRTFEKINGNKAELYENWYLEISL